MMLSLYQVAVLLLGVWTCVGQQAGEICNRADDTLGVCRNMRECLRQNGSTESANLIQLCHTTHTSELYVCCRPTAVQIARKKCIEWKHQRRSVNSTCSVKIPLIRKGEEAHVGEFPYIVSVMKEKKTGDLFHVCGGSLIALDWVLTAAHCLVTNTDVLVRLGAHDQREPETQFTRTATVRRAIIHPNYQHPQRYYDIALLQLRYNAVVSQRIQPACLPHHGRRLRAGQSLVVAGWGKTGRKEPRSPVLMKAPVESISRISCLSHQFEQNHDLHMIYPAGITDSTLCAIGEDSGSCLGDNGGPVMYAERDGEECMPELVGVVSTGIRKCGSSTVPSVYTNIEYFLDWIVDTVWKHEA